MPALPECPPTLAPQRRGLLDKTTDQTHPPRACGAAFRPYADLCPFSKMSEETILALLRHSVIIAASTLFKNYRANQMKDGAKSVEVD